MLIMKDFNDYQIINTSAGEKLEKWGDYYLLRPDPLVIWKENIDKSIVHAHYHRKSSGGGYWEYLKKLPDSWIINYKDLKFNVKLMGFKHTGVFPEQAVNWDYMREKIKSAKRDVKILNLFAYTGCASVACLKEGAKVVHVDSSRGMVDWAKENVKLNNLEDREIRFLVDDVKKFVDREIRRGNKYDAIIMDPPSYGRGSKNEVWDIEKDLFDLVLKCSKLLVEDPLFLIINSYTTGLSPIVIDNLLHIIFKGGKIDCGELGILTNTNVILPCGVYGRYEG